VRICIVYDCLFPYTIGGAERWYRGLAERLAQAGHEVTYLTMRQWPRGEKPAVPGVHVVAVGPQMELYANGRRRIAPPLVFGAGVLAHLLRCGSCYDVVHTASFPYFSVLAAGVAHRVHPFRLIVDWFEVWTREYWRDYLGKAGSIGWRVQRRCIRIPQHAFCFSRIHRERLRDEGSRAEIDLLEGLFEGPLAEPTPQPADSTVVFAGRHIPEKGVLSIPASIVRARGRLPTLRAEIFGDGPDHDRLLAAVRELGLEDAVDAPGFVAAGQVREALAHALCLLLPSRREGYGLVVVEAASLGTPSVVVGTPDNAAQELVSDGENGFVAPSDSPESLADAIVRVAEAGYVLRERTARWFGRNGRRLSLQSSLERVLDVYADGR
jgi:glycosyltransferase involved in cell wall biosynthesis